MFSLFFVFSFSFIIPSFALRVLLLGDSIDRQTVIEWCGKKGLDYQEWGGKDLTYSSGKTGRQGSLGCITSDGETGLAFVHIFGSNATGPYLNYLGGGLMDTSPRILHALEMYRNHFGSPSKVYLQFSRWDLGYLTRMKLIRTKIENNEPNYDDQIQLSRFRFNLHERIDEILNYFFKNQDNSIANASNLAPSHENIVGLRTAAWSESGGDILKFYNNITRQVSDERNLTLFDLDLDLWSIAGFETSVENEHRLFRDWIHPQPYYSYIHGQKLLELQYTRYLRHKCTQGGRDANAYYRQKFLNSLLNSSRTIKNENSPVLLPDHFPHFLTIRLIETHESLFYFNDDRLSFHLIPSLSFLTGINPLHLGLGDVLRVKND
jgi:hypothetical protein